MAILFTLRLEILHTAFEYRANISANLNIGSDMNHRTLRQLAIGEVRVIA